MDEVDAQVGNNNEGRERKLLQNKCSITIFETEIRGSVGGGG